VGGFPRPAQAAALFAQQDTTGLTTPAGRTMALPTLLFDAE